MNADAEMKTEAILSISPRAWRAGCIFMALFSGVAPAVHYYLLQPRIDLAPHPFGFTPAHLLLFKHFADLAIGFPFAFAAAFGLSFQHPSDSRRLAMAAGLLFFPFTALYLACALLIVYMELLQHA